MAKTSTCPDVGELKKLAMADFAPADIEPLLQHLQECESCLARVQTLTPKDTLVSVLAKARSTADSADDPVLSGLIARLTKLGHASLTFSCGECGKNLRIKAELAGKKVKCPACGKAIQAPAAALGVPESHVSNVAEDRTLPPRSRDTADDKTLPPKGGDTKSGLSGAAHKMGTRSGEKTQPSTPTRSASEGANDEEEAPLDFLSPAQQPDELGRLGKYRLLKKLGAGGMGMVFLAEDTLLHRKVAVKLMLPRFAASAQARERFLREARAAASIEHEHIVAIHEVGEESKVPFLVMPFLKGKPLDVYLEKEGRLAVAEALRIAAEMAEGLAAAHANGLIHRDIKPGNVWLETKNDKTSVSSGRVKLLDFGLARSEDDTRLTQSGALVGTPAYMAPEQARGVKVDGRADLFSLGCVLYLMLTGERPFKGNDTISVLSALAMDTPASPREVNAEVPQAVSDLTMRLLEKDPASRPASAADAARELAEAGRGEKATMPAPDRTTMAAGASARRRRPLFKAAMLLAGLIGAVALTVIIIRTEQGDYVIETDDPDIFFHVGKDGSVTVEDRQKQRRFNIVKVESQKKGEFNLEVTEEASGLTFDTQRFIIKRGQRVAFKALFEPRQLAKAVDPPAQLKQPDPVKTPDHRKKPASPLDLLDRTQIPKAEQLPWHPLELVAVIGSHRQRQWGDITEMALSPNGKMLATVSRWDHRLHLWNPDTMESLGQLEADGNLSNSFNSVAFSEDSRWLVAWYGGSESIHVWDCSTSPPTRSASGRNGGGASLIRVVAGKTLLMLTWSDTDGHLSLWTTAAKSVNSHGGIATKLPGSRAMSVAPDGKLIAVPGGKEIKLFEINDGKLKEVAHLKDHKAAIGRVAFSGDGKLLFAADDSQTVRIWRVDGAKTKEVSNFTHAKRPSSIAVDRSSKWVAVGGAGGFTVYGLQDGAAKELFTTPVPDAEIFALAFGTPEQGLFVGDNWGIIHRYKIGPDMATPIGEPPVRANGNFPLLRSRVARTGRVAVWHPNNVDIWDPGNAGYKLCATVPVVGNVGMSGDGNFLAAVTKKNSTEYLELWDLRGEKPLLSDRYAPRDIGVVEWLPDDKTIATGVADAIQLLRQQDGKFKPGSRFAVPGWGFPTLCSRDGGTLAAGHPDWPWYKLCLWSLKTGEPTEIGKLPVPDGWADGVALSPDGKIVAIGGSDPAGPPKLFDFSAKEPREKVLSGMPAQCLCFSPDGKYLAGANRVSGNIAIWDVATGKSKREIQSCAGRILDLVWAEDGRHLFTFNGNGTIYVLRLTDAVPQIPPVSVKELTKGTQIVFGSDTFRYQETICFQVRAPVSRFARSE